MINLFDFSVFVGSLFDIIPMIILGIVVSLYLFVKRSKKEAYFFASLLISAGILIKLLKELIVKARPLGMLIQESGYAFPSGHATIAVVFFCGLAYILSRKRSKEIKILSFILAALISIIIGFTRVYLRVHDVYDILGGFVLGTIILFSGIYFFKKL